MPRLSVVVPVLNEAHGIVVSLQALAPLRSQDVEIIVVDGGSVDATVALCAGWCDLVVQAERGRARQMNAGALRASGRILLFLHADTRLPSQALVSVEEALASKARRWGRFDVAISGRHRMLRVVAWMMNARSRLSGIATGDQALFVLRDEFHRVGGFPDQALMEDIELSRRLRTASRPVALKPQVITSGRRWEKHGVWRTIFLMWRLRLLYWLGASPEQLAHRYP